MLKPSEFSTASDTASLMESVASKINMHTRLLKVEDELLFARAVSKRLQKAG